MYYVATRLQIKVLSCFVLSTYVDYFYFLKYGKKNEKSCLWKQSPLLAPHRKWRFARLHAVCQMKMGYVKQDTWHVSKRIFWYMHLYHALLSKRTCG